jgi:hypothetical protein
VRLIVALIAFVAVLPMRADSTTAGAFFGFSPTGSQDLILTIGGGLTTIQASDTGTWGFYELGFLQHDPTVLSYFVGDNNSPAPTFRNHNDFFVFDLSNITGRITGAQLSIGNAANSYLAGGFFPGGGPNPPVYSLLSMYDVSTPIAALEGPGPGGDAGLGIYQDLRSGTLYASRAVSADDNGTQVLISLDDAAIAALNAAEGGQWAIGGSLASVPIPEPSARFLVGIVLAGLCCFAKRSAGSQIYRQPID